MDLISSRDIFYVICDILRKLDPKVMNHGLRTAYLLYKMMQCKKKYEDFEMADLCMIAVLHDIGTYKTDYLSDHLRYESRDSKAHSLYGYLFLLYLTPLKDMSKMILYHHADFESFPEREYEYAEMTGWLNVAEKMDIYQNAMGSKFDYTMFQKQAGTKYSADALEALYQAQKKFDVFGRISSGEFKNELSELFDNLIFTNEFKRDLLISTLYLLSFRSEAVMKDTIITISLCISFAEKIYISNEESENLYYAALLHDIGMCAVPAETIESGRKLSEEETATLRSHVSVTESILRGRINQDCLDIILMHHERCDGSGYPHRLRDYQMSKPAKMLQVADSIAALINPKGTKEPKSKEAIIRILEAEADAGKLNSEIVRTFVNFYDKMMENVDADLRAFLADYNDLQNDYNVKIAQ